MLDFSSFFIKILDLLLVLGTKLLPVHYFSLHMRNIIQKNLIILFDTCESLTSINQLIPILLTLFFELGGFTYRIIQLFLTTLDLSVNFCILLLLLTFKICLIVIAIFMLSYLILFMLYLSLEVILFLFHTLNLDLLFIDSCC